MLHISGIRPAKTSLHFRDATLCLPPRYSVGTSKNWSKRSIRANYAPAKEVIGMINTYQHAQAHQSLINEGRIRAELCYNRLNLFAHASKAYLMSGVVLLTFAYLWYSLPPTTQMEAGRILLYRSARSRLSGTYGRNRYAVVHLWTGSLEQCLRVDDLSWLGLRHWADCFSFVAHPLRCRWQPFWRVSFSLWRTSIRWIPRLHPWYLYCNRIG